MMANIRTLTDYFYKLVTIRVVLKLHNIQINADDSDGITACEMIELDNTIMQALAETGKVMIYVGSLLIHRSQGCL